MRSGRGGRGGSVKLVKRPHKIKVTIVGYEVQQKYSRTPVSIQDKLSFCHRAPMVTENGKFNAVFLNLATELNMFNT